MPSQPRSPNLRENAGSTPDSQVSTWVVNEPAASSSARNSRTSARTCSAASDRGAGASVNDEELMRATLPERPAGGPVRSGRLVLGRRAAGERAELADDVAGGRGQREQRPGDQPAHPGRIPPEHRAETDGDVDTGQAAALRPPRLLGQIG